MTTTVAYHADGFGPARPAINVKLRAPGYQMRSAEVDAALDESAANALHEVAWEFVASDFWQAAEETAAQLGLGAITQEGRSGGWLVFTDFDPDDYGECPYHGESCDDPYDAEMVAARRSEVEHWLNGYQSLLAWVSGYLDAAPAEIARRAQDMAMDACGAAAVNQVVLP